MGSLRVALGVVEQDLAAQRAPGQFAVQGIALG